MVLILNRQFFCRISLYIFMITFQNKIIIYLADLNDLVYRMALIKFKVIK